jgi:hypothetical protein
MKREHSFIWPFTPTTAPAATFYSSTIGLPQCRQNLSFVMTGDFLFQRDKNISIVTKKHRHDYIKLSKLHPQLEHVSEMESCFHKETHFPLLRKSSPLLCSLLKQRKPLSRLSTQEFGSTIKLSNQAWLQTQHLL